MQFDANQNVNIETVLNVGLALHAEKVVLLAMLCLGAGENDFHSYGCNSSLHCGFFQLSTSWQRQHDYHDVAFWAKWAYLRGFYGHGGLIAIHDNNPGLSPGWITQLCQGAGPSDSAAAAYYETHLGLAEETFAQYLPRYSGGGSGFNITPDPGGGDTLQVPATADYDPSPIIRKVGDDLDLHGRHAYHNADLILLMAMYCRYCTEDGPHA